MKRMLAASLLLLLSGLCACAGAQGRHERGNELIDAAQDAADHGDDRRAEELLSRMLTGPADDLQQAQVQLIRAQILLARNRPADALKRLPPVPPQPLLARSLKVRGDAQFRLGNAVAATRALVEREKYLTPAQLAENRDALWAGLFATPIDADSVSRSRELDATSRGWLELAALVRDHGNVEQWRSRYPGHPGAERIATVTERPAPKPVAVTDVTPVPAAVTLPPPQAGVNGLIALLLPLSGPSAASGEAVRDGFLSARFAAAASGVTVRVYDAGATPVSGAAAYQQAVHDGATLVVGPLRKEAVAAIAALGTPPVPVLALNYLDAGAGATNLYQFGLAPEDEARAAAENAIHRDLRSAVALVPRADWGERALAAFSQRFTELGGRVIKTTRYEAVARDFTAPIQELLAIDASNERHRALTAILGKKSEFEPRRRDDMDVIFIAARPTEGRLIWPQLRYNHVGDLPAYATSLIYSGTPEPELQGLAFCDMPWMLGGVAALENLHAETAEVASARFQPRLYAMGHDAWALAGLIAAGRLQGGTAYAAITGELSLVRAGVVERRLQCAQIDNGKLTPLATTGTGL